jgi:hypothetical protein
MTTGILTAIDRDALRRAFEAAAAEGAGYREHLDGIEARDGWVSAAESASYHLQVKNLRLRPWQCPPCSCWSDEVGHGYGRSRAEVMLRRRMLKANISLFEPDPHAALAAKARGAADTSAA